MRFSAWLGWLALTGAGIAGATPGLGPRNFDTHDYYTLHLRSGESPQSVARALGLHYEGKVGELPDHFYFSVKRGTHNVEKTLSSVRQRRRKREVHHDGLDGILWARKQRLKQLIRKRIPPPPPGYRQQPPINTQDNQDAQAVKDRESIVRKLEITDPGFMNQWHLFNTVEVGHDMNITGVWAQGITGHNATVALVDDGRDMTSDDLKANYFAEGSYDYNDKVKEPKPRLSDDHHGTRCAGEVAAVKNDVCGVGMAWDSKVSGIRILSGPISDEDEALAINHEMQKNNIYSCSWGPPDDGASMDAPDVIIRKAILNGIQNGRGGLGSIFVFASGNGAAKEDNCNFDGYTNSIYSITVGAIDRQGQHPYYSEKCSAGLVVTYSSGSGDYIHTTDVGKASCSSSHGGTSAAAPLGAGLFALALSVRPDLSWRDLQYLCVETAVPVNLDDADGWQNTTIGKKYSHTFAYGKLDSYAFIEAAKTWKIVKPQAWFKSPWQHVNHSIPQGDKGLTSIFTVSKYMMRDSNLARVEHVTVKMNVNHTRRGDISVHLRSPDGVVSHLSATRRMDDAASGYKNWTFMSVIHWGESGIGAWTLVVKDTEVNEHNGTWIDWRLSLWGESIDGNRQSLFPLPAVEDDEEDSSESHSAVVGTTSVDVPTSSTLQAHPTDHPDRPVNQKPKPSGTTTTTSAGSSGGTSALSSATTKSTGSANGQATSSPDATASASATPTESQSFFLPSVFPTFGVSPRTQIWIYGAIALILVFCIGLGCFFIIQKRRKDNIDRNDYEFAMLNTEDAGEGAGAGSKRRRGGELYDAFAGDSDEELFSDEEGSEGYRDEVNEKSGMLTSRDASPDGEPERSS